MHSNSQSDSFYANVTVFRDFTRVLDPALYKPLPDDWVIGVADVVQSTTAIREHRYKAVNMAGAAVIVAVTDALEAAIFHSCSAATAQTAVLKRPQSILLICARRSHAAGRLGTSCDRTLQLTICHRPLPLCLCHIVPPLYL